MEYLEDIKDASVDMVYKLVVSMLLLMIYIFVQTGDLSKEKIMEYMNHVVYGSLDVKEVAFIVNLIFVILEYYFRQEAPKIMETIPKVIAKGEKQLEKFLTTKKKGNRFYKIIISTLVLTLIFLYADENFMHSRYLSLFYWKLYKLGPMSLFEKFMTEDGDIRTYIRWYNETTASTNREDIYNAYREWRKSGHTQFGTIRRRKSKKRS